MSAKQSQSINKTPASPACPNCGARVSTPSCIIEIGERDAGRTRRCSVCHHKWHTIELDYEEYGWLVAAAGKGKNRAS